MKTGKKVVREQEETVSICDWCRMDIPIPGEFDTFNWHMSCREGKSFPDRSYGREWVIEDLCPVCATKLKHLLIENEIRIKEYDYGRR